MSFLQSFLLVSVIQFLRYLIIAGAAYLFFWSWKNPITEKKRIQQIAFKKTDLWREFKYSVITCLIFGVVIGAFFKDFITDDFKLQTLPYPTSLGYDITTLVVLILIHDTYFYWMHRAIHHPKLFRQIHQIHHLSKNPSPWASLAFHPLEGFLEIIWIVPVYYLIPIQPMVLIVFATVIIVINVLGHLGVEIYPKKWQSHPLLRWLNFSKMHNDHHHYVTGNYSLYFSFWDRFMGTLRK